MNDLVYLLACAVNGTVPDSGRIAALDIEKLYRQAKFHTVGRLFALLSNAPELPTKPLLRQRTRLSAR